MELPAEDVDFSAPAAFFPLAVVAAPWAAVVLTVAARPAFGDGTLQDWSLFLLSSQDIRPTAFGPVSIGNLQGLAGVGRQEQEGTWLKLRFAFFEDGGRLMQLGLMAPEEISAPLESIWQRALQSFELARPQGQNVPVGPGMGIMPASVEPELEAVAAAEPEPEQFTESEFGRYAKSDDLETLNPEHPMNARLREQGVGFVPNVLEADAEAKTAKLGAGALGAVIRVALGWYVIDDGKRTIVLDPEGKIQISLNVIGTEGRGVGQILDDIQAEAMDSHPNPEFLRLEEGGMSALAVRGIVVNDEPVEQVHLLTPWAKDSGMLRARVTADPDSMRFAANYADLILKSVEYGETEVEVPGTLAEELLNSSIDGPEWWRRAVQLERADRLDEAERLLKESIPSLHFAIQTAEMYRLRWIRLQESEPEKAKAARRQTADWAWRYASYATSGGEGTALSMERDEFVRRLGNEPFE